MGFFKQVLLLAIFSGGMLYALSNGSGVLVSGQEVVLTPQDGHSLNVVRTSGSDANFDITMSNKGQVYYSANSQIDDIYLVFHNDVVLGDRIKIHVNSGSFRYNISPVTALPAMVKKALYKKATKVTIEKPVKKYIEKKVKSPKPQVLDKPIKEKKIIKKAVYKKPKEIVLDTTTRKTTQIKSYEPKKSDNKKVLSDSFYNNFTNIFKDLVKSFSSNSPENEKIKPAIRKSMPKFKDKIVVKKVEPKKEVIKSFDDRVLMHEATVIRSDFSKLPSEIEIFDDSNLQKSAKIEKKVFKEIKKKPVVTKKAPLESPKIVLKEEPKKEVVSQPIKQVIIQPITMVPVEPKKVILKEDRIIKTAPVKSSVIENATKPKAYENAGYYPDTGYKDEYKDLNKNIEKVKQEPKVELVDNSNGKKIVITKIIEKQSEYSDDSFAGRVLGKIDNRVMGGGYNPNSGTGKFGMRVIKNSKPVSAWIEVFKNGTKDRVKTFYTSSSSKIKKVKLPAGVYMIRATYRSKGGKLQKTLKNINLNEGGDITKHITFHDGKLRVIARRADKSLYVRVTAYKSGTKDRVAFEFSDRHSGITNLTLGTGTYDIEVAEHNKIRKFNDVKITSGAMETIKAEF